MLKRTPLFHAYETFGAKTIDFGGWELPVQFSSIKEEHEAVRTKAGLFDVSHMGEVDVKGQDALPFLQRLLTNDVSKLTDGKALYTAMCYEDGGTVDDLLVYQKEKNHYLLVINASNIEKDVDWLLKHQGEDDVLIKNISDQTALLALQGPLAADIIKEVAGEEVTSLKPFTFLSKAEVASKEVLVSRTGYTGEDGFEIYCQSEDAVHLWSALLKAGQPKGLIPCGLGARDTLRFEARLPLYGQELTKGISPLEGGIGFAVKTDKEADFIGKAALKKQKEEGLKRKLVGIEMIDKGIPRTDYPVFSGEKQVGIVTTGTQSPTLKKNVGLALIESSVAELGAEVEVQVRKKRLKAKIVATPFYKRAK
ncbi:glycine cleavage system aminomethyltransferase GcvT [Bacillus safensis]|uniref:glycine cleavage system aminomethyltransferase GcvT n=1 Tax=Bacillus safensis TaxID=561879 RepID=UPI00366D334F